MRRETAYSDSKARDSHQKGKSVVRRVFFSGPVWTLILCFTLLGGGVSQAVTDNLSVKEVMRPIEVEFMPITKPQLISVTRPEFIQATEFEFLKVSRPEFLKSWIDPRNNLTMWGGEPKTLQQVMCGPSNGLPEPKVCLFAEQ